jgi:hypothetical protein
LDVTDRRLGQGSKESVDHLGHPEETSHAGMQQAAASANWSENLLHLQSAS